MIQRRTDISRKAEDANILGTLTEIAGGLQDISLSGLKAYEISQLVERGIQGTSRTPYSSVLNVFRILHFLALNHMSTRYELSHELQVPYASTTNLVGELCSYGMIRKCKVEKARTGLMKTSYCITSFGLLPLVELHSPSHAHVHEAFLEIVKTVREDFARIAENCSHLPFWKPFLRNWDVFDRNGATYEIAGWLSGAAKSYIKSRVFLELCSRINGANESSNAKDLEEDINSLVDNFYVALIERIVDFWLSENSDLKDAWWPAPRIFYVFSLNSELRHLALNNICRYRENTETKLSNLRFFETELHVTSMQGKVI
jgi:hypothetical protein